ncbi:hypothetical protein Ancab_005915 [Ancistrocladus abbreviatus]
MLRFSFRCLHSCVYKGYLYRSNRNSVAGVAAASISGVGEMNGVNSSVFFGNAPSVFDLDDLMRSSAGVLGEGFLGTAYKAVLASGTVVLKRLKGATIAQKRFKEMIEVVGAIDHENLLPLSRGVQKTGTPENRSENRSNLTEK